MLTTSHVMRFVSVAMAWLYIAKAQIYTFDNTPIPVSGSLNTLYSFFVYSHSDAPEISLGEPFVKFHGLSARATNTTQDSFKDYNSVQVSLVPYRTFWDRIIPQKFCSTQNDVASKMAEKPNQLLVQKPAGVSEDDVFVYSHVVPFLPSGDAHPKDFELPVRTSAVYILTFSNCGLKDGATISGSVIVKNAYGFLPGNEYHKLPFYGQLSLFYVTIAVGWMIKSFRSWQTLFAIQNCIAVVILLGIVEAFLWWLLYNDWNNSGSKSTALVYLSILASVTKSIFSYMLVLVASLGWGVTRPYLDKETVRKLQTLSGLLLVFGYVRELTLSYRHSHALSTQFILLCLMPVSLLNGSIFYWIFMALSGLINSLKERQQSAKLQLFQRLFKLLTFAMLATVVSLIFQICDLSRSISLRWKYQWFLQDGVHHILFSVVLVAMMYLWAPSANSQAYAFGSKDDCDKGESDKDDDDDDELCPKKKGADAWIDEGDVHCDPEEDSSFWANTHSQPKAGGEP